MSQTDSKTLTIMYGNHTFRNSSSRVFIHVCPTDGGPRVFPNSILTGGRSKAIQVAASKSGYEDHGSWFRSTLNHRDGTIISLQLNVSYHASPRTSAIMLVRLREDANLISISGALSVDAQATYKKLPMFTGHADVISIEEAEQLGVSFPRGMRTVYFDVDEVAEEFDVLVLTEGATPVKPQVVKVRRGGEVKTVMMQGVRQRKLVVKRRV